MLKWLETTDLVEPCGGTIRKQIPETDRGLFIQDYRVSSRAGLRSRVPWPLAVKRPSGLCPSSASCLCLGHTLLSQWDSQPSSLIHPSLCRVKLWMSSFLQNPGVDQNSGFNPFSLVPPCDMGEPGGPLCRKGETEQADCEPQAPLQTKVVSGI